MSTTKKKPGECANTLPELQSKSLTKGINMNMRVCSTVQASVPVSGEAFALTKAIYAYRAEWNAYLIHSMDDDNYPYSYEPALEQLEKWAQPATNRQEAALALEIAIEFMRDMDSPVIPAMVKAAHGWMKQPQTQEACQ